eukprot:gene7645-11967_t
MKFGNQLLLQRNPLWKNFYIKYDLAKKSIKKFDKNTTEKEREEFCKFLTEEIEIVNSWYNKLELLAFSTLKELKVHFASSDELYDINQQILIAEFSDMLFSLRNFVTLNDLAFQKIIKKYRKHYEDEHIEKVENLLAEQYFLTSKALDTIMSPIHGLLLHGDSETKIESKITPQPENPVMISEFNIKSLERNKIHHFFYNIATDSIGTPIYVPIIVARGIKKGPFFCINSALHGNEVNGIQLIHELMKTIDTNILIGTVICLPVSNPLGYFNKTGAYVDGIDLNKIFPGKPNGNPSQIFAHRLLNDIILQVEYLIDIQTASFGSVNSLCVSANMKDPIVRRLAFLQNPQIIVHNSVSNTSLEGAAMKLGIKSIALQIGNPLVFQKKHVKHALEGVRKIMSFLKMIPEPQNTIIMKLPIICSSSKWLNTTEGGIIHIFPEINTWVKKGELIAKVKNLFGTVVEDFYSPDDCVVIGKNSNPVTQSGTPFIYLGFCHKSYED